MAKTIEHIGKQPFISVVVPCRDEAEGLREFLRRMGASCEKSVGRDYEIILVNDGSADDTWDVMRALAKEDANVVAVSLSRNFGHQLALSAGLSVSRGDRVLIIDADLQDPPELLEKMSEIMDGGADVVYGKRISRAGDGLFKRYTAKLFYDVFRKFAEIEIPNEAGDFRLISRRMADILNEMPESNRFVRGMISWSGFKQVPLEYEREARFAGKTKYPLRKMLRFALDALTGFSVAPMRFASYLGATVGVASLVMIFYTLYLWFSGDTIQGWTSLMIVVLVLGSVQLLSLGVFGEYLGRLYIESKKRPLFIIDKIERQ
jgi:dolichol-phosphate mannosyltransferase